MLIDSNGIIKLSDVDGIVGVKSILEEKSPYQPQIPNVSTDSVYWTAPEVSFEVSKFFLKKILSGVCDKYD